MALSTEVGTELGADHRLIELLCRQLDLESDPARRQAMADKIASIVDWHETFDRRYLGTGDRAAEEATAEEKARTEQNAGAAESAEAGTAAEAPLPLPTLLARAQRHIREEEDHTLPAFESRAHWMTLEDLGERAREFRLASCPRGARPSAAR